jgi:hypothetical protein
VSGAGRFLEFSVATPDILDSLGYYKLLGFTELETGEAYDHKYAVVSDGDINIGLFDREMATPQLTFVQPELARHARSMADHGFAFTRLALEEDRFNELELRDLDRNSLRMIEARTFFPAAEEETLSVCGACFEVSLPVRDTMRAARFWAPLAPNVLELREEPTAHMRFDTAGVPFGLSESIALKNPSLSFRCADRAEFEAAIVRAGIRAQEYPGFEGAFARLDAPEGTALYIFEEDFLGAAYEVEEGGEPLDCEAWAS